ncbi:MAG: DUF6916 family protein [Pyrinomonadaceae bacterium]
MTVSRRNFIKIGSVSAALIAGNCLGLENGVFGQARNIYGKRLPAEVYSDSLFSYRADTFRRLVGSEFSLFTEDFAATAVLSEVQDSVFTDRKKLRGKSTIVSSEDFTLLFDIPYGTAKQATYTVIHRDLGQFDLLLVPGQNQKGGFLLSAVINRL